MTGALLALALAAAPLAQEEWGSPREWEDEAPAREGGGRLRLSAWAGEAWDEGGTGRSFDVAGGEAAWAFEHLDVGVAGYGWRGLEEPDAWTPVAMLRLTQRFELRTGVEAAFAIGLGASRPAGWDAWFQVALGVRIPLGPLFLCGELAFERGDLLRLGAGLGAAVF